MLSHLRRIYGETSTEASEFVKLRFKPPAGYKDSASDYEYWLKSGISCSRSLLSACEDGLKVWHTDAPPSLTALDRAVAVCETFHRSALVLRDRYGTRAPLVIADEYDVQYLLAALLPIHFDDVVAEDYVPAYAGGTSRIDFVLRPERIAIETKMTRATLRDKEVGEELLIDLARYETHPAVDSLICLVHDPARLIKNPRGLATDLETTPSRLKVRVVIRG